MITEVQKREIAEKYGIKLCPNCPDQGWFADYEPRTGDLEQVQCEFCETEPKSWWNWINHVVDDA